ncbi:unnamed protein product [Schistosoma curassoni]|uniref:Ovule protein n=1 Tax=Schistosoma curassoni TaxID=6186 RepID=A0A183L3L7_9TREM|nr:unnamed protein product [Schistosoma curassoni]
MDLLMCTPNLVDSRLVNMAFMFMNLVIQQMDVFQLELISIQLNKSMEHQKIAFVMLVTWEMLWRVLMETQFITRLTN